jgi:chromate transporter
MLRDIVEIRKSADEAAEAGRNPAGSALEVLWVFLMLGVSSFGGPAAHLGRFRQEFVSRRRWLDDSTFADLVGLCQFLPGPGSSQAAFSIGLMRAGWAGAVLGWASFSLPSAALMTAFALGAGALNGRASLGLIHGLKLVAVAIVAQAVWGMARTSAASRTTATIALGAALMVLLANSSLAQVGVIAAGAATGVWLCRTPKAAEVGKLGAPVSRMVGLAAGCAFLLLLVGLPAALAVWPARGLAMFEAFYRSGALVFGGGHVVLPLLRQAFVPPGWVSDNAFLAGYGAAQAVPGPLFSFGAYLGAMAGPPAGGLPGAALGLIGLSLPGLLIVAAALPFWDRLRRRADAQGAMRGVNAAVVGLLGAALYSPIWTSSVTTPIDFAIALGGFVLLTVWRAPPVVVVALGALAGLVIA